MVTIILMMVMVAQSTELEARTDLDSVSSSQGSSAQSQLLTRHSALIKVRADK